MKATTLIWVLLLLASQHVLADEPRRPLSFEHIYPQAHGRMVGTVDKDICAVARTAGQWRDLQTELDPSVCDCAYDSCLCGAPNIHIDFSKSMVVAATAASHSAQDGYVLIRNVWETDTEIDVEVWRVKKSLQAAGCRQPESPDGLAGFAVLEQSDKQVRFRIYEMETSCLSFSEKE